MEDKKELEEENSPEEEQKEDIYSRYAAEEPAREVELPDGDRHKSLEDSEKEDPNLSDMQVTLRKLFPDFGDKIYNSLMMARIAPDMFIPLLRILVNAAIKRMDAHQPLNVAEKASLFYILCSIGLDGKGRIDTIELAGSANDDAELEKLGKSLGAF